MHRLQHNGCQSRPMYAANIPILLVVHECCKNLYQGHVFNHSAFLLVTAAMIKMAGYCVALHIDNDSGLVWLRTNDTQKNVHSKYYPVVLLLSLYLFPV